MAVGHVNASHYIQDIMVLVDTAVFPGPWLFPPLLGEAKQALCCRCYLTSHTHQQLLAIDLADVRSAARGPSQTSQDLVNAHGWTNHVAALMTESA